MSLTVKELNNKLIELINGLDPQPTGDKGYDLFGKKSKLTGVAASEKAAQIHSTQLKLYSLKSNFEQLGLAKQLPPALLAGKGSRESGLGTTLASKTNIKIIKGKRTSIENLYWGWGDYSQRSGEKSATYHGFGILQIDRKTSPKTLINNELTKALGVIQLNPFDYRWLEIGADIFLEKLKISGVTDFSKATSNSFATALSRYNGGAGKLYPNSDQGTTGGDYANDTLIRARWFAQNWEKI